MITTKTSLVQFCNLKKEMVSIKNSKITLTFTNPRGTPLVKGRMISEQIFFTNEKIWQISALAPSKSDQIKKIMALSFINHGLFNVIKCLYFFWFDHSLSARAEICQIFSLVLWKTLYAKISFWNYLYNTLWLFAKAPEILIC